MLKIWGRMSSSNVQKVVWCAHELGIAFQRIEAGGKFGLVDTPEYRAMNPNGLIPVIEDDGFVLWESNAIVRYLSAKHGAGSLWPTELHARASSDRWMDWHTTELNPMVGNVFKQLIRTEPGNRNEALIESSRLGGEKRLAMLDAHLVSHEFVAGATFTMGDIPLGVAIARWSKLPIEREVHPLVARWFALIEKRPAADEVMRLTLS
jgi:glutathione S-transferase